MAVTQTIPARSGERRTTDFETLAPARTEQVGAGDHLRSAVEQMRRGLRWVRRCSADS